MIKENVTWTGFDKRQVNRTFYFNLTEYEVMGEVQLEVLKDRIEKFQTEVTADEQRDMSPPEIREMLDIIKTIVRYAYGETRQTPEGSEFWKEQQDPNIWNRFVASGGFNAFILHLFEQPTRANAFMMNIWPDMNGAQQEADQNASDGIQTLSSVPDISSLEDTSGTFQTKDKLEDYTQDELLNCPDGEFEAVFRKFSQGRNVPLPLLVVAGKRQNKTNMEETPQG